MDLKRRLAASEELVSNLQSASANPAEEAADSAMVPPLKSLRNTSHLLRVYLDVVGPLELNRSWRLPPQVTQNEANCLRRQIADYTNYMLVVLDECKEEDFHDFWQAAERIEKRRKRGFTAIAKEAIKFAPERHSPLNNALQDEALFKRLRSLLKEAPSPCPCAGRHCRGGRLQLLRPAHEVLRRVRSLVLHWRRSLHRARRRARRSQAWPSPPPFLGVIRCAMPAPLR